ncbi:decaprenyl-phosphate phosphoribosyltransferase [Paenibacillus sp. GYB003]|uniref:decaprenyl-phosphate phosphoribosyltransferase n=1 Tax=Paenibacillus sp. GYB003 TaxID=2994392 RepID=UPI002F967AC5
MQKNSNIITLLIKQLRPKQWTKNLLVFAALFFSENLFNLEGTLKTIVAFILFCLVSGCVYIVNDYVDREADRLHPEKRYRPMASGALNPVMTLIFGMVLLTLSIAVGFYLKMLFGLLIFLYFLINIAYSFKLKHIVILDIMVIASGFVLRAIGGGLVINVQFTPWFLLCTLLLALFLAVGKRRHELVLLQQNKGIHRKVLDSYTITLLDQFTGIVTTATIICYAIFTFTSGHSLYLMWTIPLVIYGIFRYLYIIHVEGKGGAPEKLLLQDKHILLTVFLYVVATLVILYLD